jgi:hypothetical protein
MKITLLRIPNLFLFFHCHWWFLGYWQFCDILKKKNRKTKLGTMLPGLSGRSWQLIYPYSQT